MRAIVSRTYGIVSRTITITYVCETITYVSETITYVRITIMYVRETIMYVRETIVHTPVYDSLHESFNVDYLSVFLYIHDIPGRLFQDCIKKVHTLN